MDWKLWLEVFYVVLSILVCIRIIIDTRSNTKALAYILLTIFVPVAGMIVYFSIGINYRKRKMYSKNIFGQNLRDRIHQRIDALKQKVRSSQSELFPKYDGLVDLVLNQSLAPITADNEVDLLINGEEKFPQVIKAIQGAKHHIHIEYYIFEDDSIGLTIIDLLIEKAAKGIKVRFIYDDFGSGNIRKHQVKRMRAAGIEVYPFYKIKLIYLANRLNYRNHRKIIVIDGELGFVGGINVSDKYINQADTADKKLFWRDTHLKIKGRAVSILQYIFIGDWNYCSGEKLKLSLRLFPEWSAKSERAGKPVQIVASGPDSDTPLIMQSLMKAIGLANEEILITTPYFIPGGSLKEVISMAALSNIKVKLLVPGKSDSKLVNLASHSYFKTLLKAGVEIYTYQKGFVHAKTMVVDGELAVVGTANMDIRSFDLNFEVNAMVYDREFSETLRTAFYEDLKGAQKIELKEWKNRPLFIRFLEKIAGLISPLL